ATLPADTVGPGGWTYFILRLDAATNGSYSGELEFETNDGGYFGFDVSGTVTGGAPEIGVSLGITTIHDGTDTVDLGNALTGQVLPKTFTITNSGTANLTLSSLSVPSGFT